MHPPSHMHIHLQAHTYLNPNTHIHTPHTYSLALTCSHSHTHTHSIPQAYTPTRTLTHTVILALLAPEADSGAERWFPPRRFPVLPSQGQGGPAAQEEPPVSAPADSLHLVPCLRPVGACLWPVHFMLSPGQRARGSVQSHSSWTQIPKEHLSPAPAPSAHGLHLSSS